jgi:hypothetical protein
VTSTWWAPYNRPGLGECAATGCTLERRHAVLTSTLRWPPDWKGRNWESELNEGEYRVKRCNITFPGDTKQSFVYCIVWMDKVRAMAGGGCAVSEPLLTARGCCVTAPRVSRHDH